MSCYSCHGHPGVLWPRHSVSWPHSQWPRDLPHPASSSLPLGLCIGGSFCLGWNLQRRHPWAILPACPTQHSVLHLHGLNQFCLPLLFPSLLPLHCKMTLAIPPAFVSLSNLRSQTGGQSWAAAGPAAAEGPWKRPHHNEPVPYLEYVLGDRSVLVHIHHRRWQ
jgi:hypothetical protein